MGCAGHSADPPAVTAMREARARNLSYAPAPGHLYRLHVTDRQAIAIGGSTVLREPTDPTGVVVIAVGEQLVLESSQELADEGVMPVPGEGVVGEQQQPEVRLVAIDTTLMAADEVRDVVGDHRSMLLGSVVEQEAVVHATKMLELKVLDSDDVVAAGTELLGGGSGDHLIEQQSHSRRACSAS